MNNKETLQSYNTNLSENNTTLASILETINNLPEAGSGEDISEELTTQDASLDTQGVTISDIIYALAGKGVPVDESAIEPDYITDGLVAWWEGCDDLDENEHWNSRVGDDYIYANYIKAGSTTYNSFDTIKSENAYRNNMVYGLRTAADYYLQGYTIEIVGKANTVGNSSTSPGSSASCTFISFQKTASPLIGVGFNNGLFFCLNVSANSSGSGLPTKVVNCVGKRHKYAINLVEIPERSQADYNQIDYSVNNSGWFSMDRAKASIISTYAEQTNIACYYADSYLANCEINSIRIYNRQLTEEELLHNYEIDNARFKLDDYETE